ncbi:MAG: hypothetical protein ACXVCG_08370 [Bdellovibrionota bacterium]
MENTMKSSYATHAGTRPILNGIVTGQIAGLIMAVVVMLVFTVVFGKSPLYPVQVIGSMVFGEAALPNFNLRAVLAGLALHQGGPSLLWGALFGILATKVDISSTATALGFGLALGVVSMTGPYLLIPALMHALHGVDIWNREVPMFWDWAAHLVFGASFALYPLVRQKLTH